ncbi:MAG: Gfo/Idh/MocA family protein [Armatimonadota bacterium]
MINIGLYGVNGHQLPFGLPPAIRARVTAVAGYPAERLDEALGAGTAERRAIKEYGTLDELLADPEVDLVSLCSPRRADQPAEALRCLRAGKHVLAEKPGAFTDAQLDELLETERQTGKAFREMLDHSMLEPNVRAMRRLVEEGALGTVVQVQTQKSYPWLDRRPQDFETDGGLIRQAGIHATRFIIGATGLRIVEVSAVGTNLGNPGPRQMHMAAVVSMTLENGAVAALSLNYLNPSNFGSWGNEHLRVHGTRGMAESVDGFRRHQLYLPGRESTELPLVEDVSTSYLEHYVNYLLDGTPFPTRRDEEIAALRAVISAHEAALTGKTVKVKV